MKRLFLLLFTHALSAAVGVLICYFYFNWSAILSSDFNVRENGVAWFSFGPGVISNSTCLEMEISLGDLSHRIQVTDPAKINQIKQWILDNKLEQRWNYSPRWPQEVGHAVSSTYYISMNGSTTDEPEEKLRSSIVTLPLEPLPMGLTQSQWSQKIDELKTLLGAK
jgi:hypothetical protein